LLELFVLGIQESSILEFFLTNFSPLFYFVLVLVFFSCALSFIAVNKIGNIIYLLILVYLPLGFLFNFSILFLFFAIGLYLINLYILPLSDTYKEELKKWKKFRIGSNAVGKSLFFLFLFVFVGSFLTFSLDNSYKINFRNSTVDSLQKVVVSEINNFQTPQNVTTEDIINTEIRKFREQNPGLSEEQYRLVEENIRNSIKNNTATNNDLDLDKTVRESLENSLLMNSLLIWFPFYMSLTLWIFLEFIRNFIISPISGIFSYIFFKLSENNKLIGRSRKEWKEIYNKEDKLGK
jgi:hypothetical protein